MRIMILGPLTRVASLLQEVVLHCGGLEPLLLPAYTCILRGIRKFGSKLLHKPISREAMHQVVASFEKAVGVRPSPLQLVRAMNSTVWKPVQHGSSPDSGPPGDQQVEVQNLSTPVGLRENLEHVDVSRWYAVAWTSEERTACECTGNCLSSCPARVDKCGNPVDTRPANNKKHVKNLCEACRCRVHGCFNSARRPFGAHKLAHNYGKCRRHWDAPAQPSAMSSGSENTPCPFLLGLGWLAVGSWLPFAIAFAGQPQNSREPSAYPVVNQARTANQQRTIYEPASNQARIRPEPSTNQQKTCSRLTESNVKSNETRQHMITEAITKQGEQK